jgi:predicted transcriptional regulator
MNTRDKIITHLGSLPLTPLTQGEIADRLDVSAQGVWLAMSQLLAAGKIGIAGKDGRRTLYRVLAPIGKLHQDPAPKEGNNGLAN